MSQSKNVYRKANGQRVEGAGLAIRIAQEIKGKLLAHAFVIARSAGFQLRINKFDDVSHGNTLPRGDLEIINVDVDDGTIKNSWIGTPCGDGDSPPP